MRHKKPDMKNAQSILISAEKEMRFTLSISINEDSASTIIRNVYECFRKLGDAMLIKEGKESRDHVEPLKALMNLKVTTKRPLGILENLRRIRHNINYYGYSPEVSEVNDTIDIAKSLFYPLLKKIKGEIVAN